MDNLLVMDLKGLVNLRANIRRCRVIYCLCVAITSNETNILFYYLPKHIKKKKNTLEIDKENIPDIVVH